MGLILIWTKTREISQKVSELSYRNGTIGTAATATVTFRVHVHSKYEPFDAPRRGETSAVNFSNIGTGFLASR